MDGIGDIPMERNAHPPDDLLIIIFHSPVDPVQHDPHKTEFIKFRNKPLIFLGEAASGTLF